jgi:hypothetical protein
MQKSFDDIPEKITHFNIPQQKAWIVAANIILAIIGRAGGKTHGFIAPISLRNVKGMPRGGTGFVGPTYIKLENDLIPALRKALEKFGFYEGIDYWIGQNIPKNIPHEKPYECPSNPQYSVFWRNGHIFRLIGLDRKDSGNAQSNDYIIGDEAKFIKKEAFDSRIVPTNRGNEDVFGHLSYHHGLLFCTDMPTSPESQWLFEYEKMMDQEQIDLIVSYDFERQMLLNELADTILEKQPGLSTTIKHNKEKLLETMRELVAKDKLHQALEKRFRKELKRLDDILFELRREAVHFIEASTLDNIDVVTERYLRQMQRVLSPKQFNASILNIREIGADFAFYGTFDEVKHTYTDINYSYTDQFKSIHDLPEPWRKDGDVDTGRALEIACDWNAAIVSMEVGQEFRHVFKILNSLEVEHPFRIKHLARKFDEYYKNYPTRNVTHHYDQTATGVDASREISYAQELAQELTALGWTIDDHYIGAAPTHESRYKLFARVYAEDDANTKPIRINRSNCDDNLVISLQNTGLIETPKGHRKDKKPESQASVQPKHAPHHGDAHDTLYIGVFQTRIGHADFEPGFSI